MQIKLRRGEAARIVLNQINSDRVRDLLLVIPVVESGPKGSGQIKSKSRTGNWKVGLSERSTKSLENMFKLLKLSERALLGPHALPHMAGGKSSIHLPLAMTSFSRANTASKRSAKQESVARSLVARVARLSSKLAPAELLSLGADAIRVAEREKLAQVVISLEGISNLSAQQLRLISEGIKLAAYSDRRFKSKKSSEKFPSSVELLVPHTPSKNETLQTKAANVATDAVYLCRDLVNAPPNKLRPPDLVKACKRVAASSRYLSAKVLDEKALRRLGAECLLSVGDGSDAPSFLVHLTYTPPRNKLTTKSLHVALVGKGVTFDSGGYSIKPANSMDGMKTDMAGAACVLSVLEALSKLPKELSIPHRVSVFIPTVENMINGSAMRVGDVVGTIRGTTVENLNTDAEGRMILADALTYSERFKPDLVIDLATLTGACKVALGDLYAGLFSNSTELQHQLQIAAANVGELVWPLPLAKEYRSNINSHCADIKNIGFPGGAGATIGALFLQEFIPKNTPWAHFDIAGPARADRESELTRPGSTGYGVRLLLEFLRNLKTKPKLSPA